MTNLERIQLGPIQNNGDLAPGEFRELRPGEKHAMQELAKKYQKRGKIP
ncbi:hypothetical protein [Aerococcus kribbianus]|uniref:Uncharacterized protein n=1 Tax=Aerococcus kribbianus TaxID=2999064 RepID=A0A9X3FN13_9LACT|nr:MULTISPECIES: hypothetical protein [unclassified Aerococcus]MCZ0717552.1 hypothetical protein [Aerococcus sp. YH-aer221]MCZ0725840.1 hypothetical protein [Aerococcus sp. YH-aer222]